MTIAYDGGRRTHALRRTLAKLAVLAIVATAISYGLAQAVGTVQAKQTTELLQLAGLQDMNSVEMETLVTKKNVVAYWVGPETGYRYILNASIPGQVAIKYVPAETGPTGTVGRTTRSSLREIVTYAQENAFEVVRAQRGTGTCQNFVNGDGNAVFLDSAVPGLVYVGIKDSPIQVVMFDPNPSRNLLLACAKGGLVPVGKP